MGSKDVASSKTVQEAPVLPAQHPGNPASPIDETCLRALVEFRRHFEGEALNLTARMRLFSRIIATERAQRAIDGRRVTSITRCREIRHRVDAYFREMRLRPAPHLATVVLAHREIVRLMPDESICHGCDGNECLPQEGLREIIDILSRIGQSN